MWMISISFHTENIFKISVVRPKSTISIQCALTQEKFSVFNGRDWFKIFLYNKDKEQKKKKKSRVKPQIKRDGY